MTNQTNKQGNVRVKALIWAAIIIVAAITSVLLGLNQGASLGIVGGLTGAAWGSLQTETACGRECLQ